MLQHSMISPKMFLVFFWVLVQLPTPIRSIKISVYIHAGQSNMEGQGSIEHLQVLLRDPTTAERYQHLIVPDNVQKDATTTENEEKKIQWVVRKDVYVRYNENERQGALTTGFGFRTHRFGPELEFGHLVGNALHNKNIHKNNNNPDDDDDNNDETNILFILKTTWGGSSLACDFRPPSSGVPTVDYELMGDDGTSKSKELVNKTCGHRYHEMMKLIDETLFQPDHDHYLGTIIPNDTQDYVEYEVDILGFLWFQGFSDVIDDRKLEEYPQNLYHLLMNVRQDLNLPELPIVVGELGMQGTHPDPKHALMREHQQNVTNIISHCKLAQVSPYMVVNPTDGYDYDGAGNFHYNGRADNFIEIGRIFAETALSFFPTMVSSYNDDDDDDNNNNDDYGDAMTAVEAEQLQQEEEEEEEEAQDDDSNNMDDSDDDTVEIPAMEPEPEWVQDKAQALQENKAQELQEEMEEEHETEETGDDARWRRQLRHASTTTEKR